MSKPDELKNDLLQKIVGEPLDEPTSSPTERRVAPRFSIRVAVVCQCLDESSQPVGSPIDGLALNISASGVLFATKAEVSTAEVLLTFVDGEDTLAETVVKVARRSIHQDSHVIAGIFVRRD